MHYPTPAHARDLADQIARTIARDAKKRQQCLDDAVRRIDAADNKRIRRCLRRQV